MLIERFGISRVEILFVTIGVLCCVPVTQRPLAGDGRQGLT